MVLGIPGTENINLGNGNFTLSKFMGGLGQFVTILVLFIVVGGIVYWIYYLKKKKKDYNKRIVWFEEVEGIMKRIGVDYAKELIIPRTNINVFYIKSKDMYLPRPVIRMGDNEFWFAIRNNRELVNFSMKNINKEMEEANLNFDHTDQRYALTNLKELIKRNYRDKSQPWWREYKEVISLVILIFVLTLSFIFIISKVGTLIDKVGALIDNANALVKVADAKSGSGVIMK